jgi:RND family efflux transporter MFP subunit
MRRRAALLAPALVLAALPLSCSRDEPVETAPRPVRLHRIESSSGVQPRTFSGVAHAGVESQLSFRVRGPIRTISVKIGDRVRRGELLAELDPDDYQLNVQERQAALDQARAQRRNAEAGLERVRGLYEANNASQSEYDQALALAVSARAQVDSAEKRLRLAENNLSYTRLLAPDDGTVAEVLAEVNENVAPGRPVLVLNSGRLPEVSVGIPEVFISRVHEAQAVAVSFDALGPRSFPASVSEVGVSPLGRGTVFPVTVQLAEANAGIRPGMAAEVTFRFETEDGRERILVPAVAVGEDRAGRFVFVAEPGEGGLGTVSRRAVHVGELAGEEMEILEGLAEGDLVVVAGLSRVEDGQTVRMPEDVSR